MKVKLEHLEVFMTLDKNQCQVVNARKQIANIIYSQGAGLGLAGQALAVKMWNGSDETEYTDDEVKSSRNSLNAPPLPASLTQ